MLENRSQDKDLYNDMVRLDPLRYEYLTVVLLPPQYYHFSIFAMCLNEMQDSMQLAPTDSRVRPDIRCMEEGKIGEYWVHFSDVSDYSGINLLDICLFRRVTWRITESTMQLWIMVKDVGMKISHKDLI